MPANRTTSSGLEYGPTHNGKTYLSIFRHRGTGSRRHKNMWATNILPDTEYSIFCSADEKDWYDASGHYWGVLNQGHTILGEQGERICKFPYTQNSTDPWHGYPTSPREGRENDTPSDVLVESWIAESVVTKEMGRKIQKFRI